MITMNELVDLRMQQHIAHEIYRQQIMQRIPDPFPPMMPISMNRHIIMPPRVTLPGVEVTLQNDDLWKEFHQIGTEMIITKSGRRMFPSMRLALSGLDDETNYCVLLEMVPIGDCRYKFSGSQWVPAGGAEPQSPQRMCLHPDSPATGSHWQAQPILFNKVKLTNNTLDNNGHIVLASMHKYQPRIHVIRTSDLTQIPWAPQQAFVFPETEFVAVTAYQNDRITKLKIDNNPFAKGFRESGQSRCKRKMSSSPSDDDQDHSQQQQQPATHQQQHHQQSAQNEMSPTKSTATTTSDSGSSICSDKLLLALQQDADADADDDVVGPQIKRMRSNGSACSISSLDDVDVAGVSGASGASSFYGTASYNLLNETSSPNVTVAAPHELNVVADASSHHHGLLPPNVAFLTASAHSEAAAAASGSGATSSFMHHFQQNMQTLLRPSLVDLACSYFGRPQPIYPPQHHVYHPQHAAFVAAAAAATAAAGNRSQYVGDSPAAATTLPLPEQLALPAMQLPNRSADIMANVTAVPPTNELDVSLSESQLQMQAANLLEANTKQETDFNAEKSPPKRKGFSISAILGGSS